MGKKRKASGGRHETSGPNLDVGNSRMRIQGFEDVADSDDEFHLNRDKVLLDEGPEAKRRRKWQEQEEFLKPSDEEVLQYSEEDEDDESMDGMVEQNGGASDSVDSSVEDGGDEGDETGWGMSRGDIYGADEIETEEQALEEEKEALRLQKRQLQSMTAADYGFDESEWAGENERTGEERSTANVVTEALPQLQISKDMSAAEKLKMLKTRNPEFDPLRKELLTLRATHAQLAGERQSHTNFEGYSNLTTKLRACTAYIGALTMYFALLTSPAFSGKEDAIAMSASQLRDHPIMDTLLKCRETWQRAQQLPEDRISSSALRNGSKQPSGIITDEPRAVQPRQKKDQGAQKSRAQRHAEAVETEARERRAERLQRTEDNLADLDALMVPSKAKKSKKARTTEDAGSDFEEEAALTAHEAAEKAKKKKSLRFYTSQIAQKANKRGAAGRNAGGDDDIPYRERLKDRQARLNTEAERRGQRNAKADIGADLGDSDAEDQPMPKSQGGDEGTDDYYDQLVSHATKKKADKVARAEAYRQAAEQGGQVREEETVGADGKRKITYAIEKNKGLTPHRKKDVRNPRVKKRKKFDEKKKKLGSIKPVYKGASGPYAGEMTGIKSNLVRSTKL